MKINIFRTLALGTAVMALASCSENSWNEHLDGFKGNPGITDEKAVEYTLTSADYASIANESANKALAGDNIKELTAVGKQGYFTENIQAKDYAPAFLASTNFPYFALDNGSSVKLTYREAISMPEEVIGMNAATNYTVTEADYQKVWGSNEDYTEAFAPSKPYATNLPRILATAVKNAKAGDYVIATFNESQTDPVFNTVEEKFELGSVIGSLKKGDNTSFNAVVTGLCTSGMILTDKSGSVFAYFGSSFKTDDYPIGTQVAVDAVIGAYNTGLQVTGSSSTFTVKGKQDYTYPTAKSLSGSDLDAAAARSGNLLAEYATITGKVKMSGSNINIIVDGASKAQGGIYYGLPSITSKLTDGQSVKLTGYFIAVAAKRYCNFVATSVEAATKAAGAGTRVVTVASEVKNVVYVYDGSTWKEASNTLALNPSDYTAMGSTTGDLSKPEEYLPTYLRLKAPYAKADDIRYVVYRYYDSSSKKTSFVCNQYTFNGSEWIAFDGTETVTSQFVKLNGAWIYDPNVTITLPAGRNQAFSALYYQAIVDWVYENIDKPLGSTSITSGVGYVTKYGNNEYYSGASAYQGNVDLRASSARSQYAAGYADMSDEQVVATMKERFTKTTLPVALAVQHPDAKPIAGLEVIYTVNFSSYDGSTTTAHVAKYKVTGPAKFEFMECDW